MKTKLSVCLFCLLMICVFLTLKSAQAALPTDWQTLRDRCFNAPATQKTKFCAEALTAFEAGIKTNPKDADAYYNMGAVFSALGRKDEALLAYQNAIKMDPKNTEAYNNICFLLKKLSRMDEWNKNNCK